MLTSVHTYGTVVACVNLYSAYMLTNLCCAREITCHGITQCYLPPDTGDSHAFTPAYCRYSFIDPGTMNGWVDTSTVSEQLAQNCLLRDDITGANCSIVTPHWAGVNDLPRVATWRLIDQDSNQRPFNDYWLIWHSSHYSIRPPCCSNCSCSCSKAIFHPHHMTCSLFIAVWEVCFSRLFSTQLPMPSWFNWQKSQPATTMVWVRLLHMTINFVDFSKFSCLVLLIQ